MTNVKVLRFFVPLLACVGSLALADAGSVIPPQPIAPHAVFLSLKALEDPTEVDRILALRHSNAINALVIDVKAESGELSVEVPSSLAPNDRQAVVRRRTILGNLLQQMHAEGMYAIARIPVFKDDALARSHPGLGLMRRLGVAFRGSDGKRWTNPDSASVRSYNIAVALAAARAGFDEVQFDYIRFPTRKAPRHGPLDNGMRASINVFLSDARTALAPYHVFLSADVFGYASWDRGDLHIGQNLEDIAARVDYVCLMLYPSAFRNGLPAARQPLDQPGEIVRLSLEMARQRTGLPAERFRPWLQAFQDHTFDKRRFGRTEIAAQVNAAEAFGTNGWLLFQPQSNYDPAELPQSRAAMR